MPLIAESSREILIPMVIEDDPASVAESRRRQELVQKNLDWLEQHHAEVYAAENRGKFICIAGQEMFVADTVKEALALGRAKHPEDDCALYRFFRPVPLPRIYAYRRQLGTR